MTKTKSEISPEAHTEAVAAAFERGVHIHHSRILAAIDYQILNFRSGGDGDGADSLSRLKTKLPTPESTIEVRK